MRANWQQYFCSRLDFWQEVAEDPKLAEVYALVDLIERQEPKSTYSPRWLEQLLALRTYREVAVWHTRLLNHWEGWPQNEFTAARVLSLFREKQLMQANMEGGTWKA